MLGVDDMPLSLRLKNKEESEQEVKNARLQIDLAILEMEKILDKVQEQATKAKEELDERRAD